MNTTETEITVTVTPAGPTLSDSADPLEHDLAVAYQVIVNGQPIGPAVTQDDADLIAAELAAASASRRDDLNDTFTPQHAKRVAERVVAQLAESRRQIAGLRQLADWLEERPLLPASVICWSPSISTMDQLRARAQLAELLARAGDVETTDRGVPGELCITRRFDGDVAWHVDVSRHAIVDLPENERLGASS